MSHDALARRLGTGDAVGIGLAAMLGAGVFVAFGPAAAAAGGWLVLAVALAGMVAAANATSTAQLAVAHPTSGGVYVYGRAQLGPWWGYLAGWGFVVGKTASCAAMALAFGTYVAPEGWARLAAAGVVVAITAAGYRGVHRTARLARWGVAIVLISLVVAVGSGLGDGELRWAEVPGAWPGLGGVLEGAGLMFFAFAGYARIATLGEEVRDPRRTIPRAIVIGLGVVLLVYVAVGLALLGTLGADGVASSSAPVAAMASLGGSSWVGAVVRVGAAVAAAGALLALLAGVARTVLAMARERDLPGALAAVHPRFAVPHRAELLVAGVVVVLVLTVDLRGAIGFSSFGVLLYYLVANVAAFTQGPGERRYPRAVQVAGALTCVALMASLPRAAVVGGLVVLAVGVVLRLVRVRRVG
ncbi:amino acid transporter [Flavimobilis marinus]|uniref:Amino acid/polyamine/organocation transporter, APC superfamily n=1 Tax=Flavimobilis marinus TaxID=285351 RepID=A0A1I2FMW2_9MICO|nr:APC family permease [Flavimobilis marinus]GHG51737.1 amino acid transporter [Flavimobilis marinus]SFF06139.1 amino acid/polyamine/organocation transporter, APC superfamily [Flavimobilis marinus]